MITKRESQIYAWGSDTYGQIGLNGTHKSHTVPKQIRIPHQIKSLSCGQKHIAFINAEGQVYTQGCNIDGKLGINSKTIKSSNVPVKVSLPATAIKIQCGLSHTLVILDNGQVYAWGLGQYGALGIGQFKTKWKPTKVFFQGVKIKTISGGAMHSGFVSFNGQVFTCGSNEYGELGNNRKQKISTPIIVQIKSKIIDIACGIFYTLLLDENGFVYAMGNNKYGQLGTGNKTPQPFPVMIRSLQNQSIVKICTGYHSGALNNKGELLLWGSGTFGEYLKPVKIKKNNFFIDLSIGGFFGIAVDNKNYVYTWGNNNFGELGLGHFEGVKQPTQIQVLRGKNIQRVYCGINFVIAMSYNKDPVEYPRSSYGSANLRTDRTYKYSIDNREINSQIIESDRNQGGKLVIQKTIKDLKGTVTQLQKNEKQLIEQKNELQRKIDSLSKDYEKLSSKYEMIQIIVSQKQKIIGIYQNKIKQLTKTNEIILEENTKLNNLIAVRSDLSTFDKLKMKDQLILKLQTNQQQLRQQINRLKNQIKGIQSNKFTGNNWNRYSKESERELTQKYEEILNEKQREITRLKTELQIQSRRWNLQSKRKQQYNRSETRDQQRGYSTNRFKSNPDRQTISKYQNMLKQQEQQLNRLYQQNKNLESQLKKQMFESRRKDENIKYTTTKVQNILRTKQQQQIEITRNQTRLEHLLKQKEREIFNLNKQLNQLNFNYENGINFEQQKNNLIQQFKQSERQLINKFESIIKQKDNEINQLYQHNSSLGSQWKKWAADSRRKDQNIKFTNDRVETMLKVKQEEQNQYIKKIKKLEGFIKKKDEEIYDLNQRLRDEQKNALLVKQYKKTEKDIIARYENRYKEKQNQAQEIVKEKQDLSHELKRWLSESRRKDETISQFQTQIEALLAAKQQQHRQNIKKISKLESNLKKREAQIVELNNNLKQEQKNMLIKYHKMSEKQIVTKYENLIKHKETKLLQLGEQIESLNNQIRRITMDNKKRQENYKQQNRKLQTIIRDNEDQNSQQIKKINKLEHTLKKKEEQILQNARNYKEEINQYDIAIKQKELAYNQLQSQNNSLSQQLKKWSNDNRKRDQSLKITNAKIEQLLKSKEQDQIQYIKKINKIQSVLKSKEQQLIELNKRINEQNQQNRKQSTTLTFKQNSQIQLKNKLKSKQQQILNLNNLNTQLKQQVKKQEKSLKLNEESQSKLKIELSKQIQLNYKYSQLVQSSQRQINQLTTIIQELKQQNNNIRQTLASKQSIIQKLSSDSKHKHESLIKLTEQYLKPLQVSKIESYELKGVVENLQFQLKKYSNTLKTKDQIQTNLNRELEKEVALSTKMKSEVDQLTFQLKRAQKQIQQLRILNIENDKNLQIQVKILKQEKTKFEKIVETKQLKIRELELNSINQNDTISKLESQNNYEKNVNKKAEENYKRLNEQCIQLRKTIAGNQANIQLLNENIQINKAQIDRFKRYKKEVDQKNLQSIQTNSFINEQQSKIQILNNQLNLKTKTLKDLQGKFKYENQEAVKREQQLNTEIRKLKDKNLKQSNENKELEDKLNKSANQLSKSLQDNYKQKDFWQGVQKKADMYVNLLQNQRKQKDELVVEIGKIKKQLTVIKLERDQLKKSLYEKQKQIQKSTQRIKNNQQNFSEIQQQNTKMKKILENLEEQNQNLKQQLQKNTKSNQEYHSANEQLIAANSQFAKNQAQYIKTIQQLERQLVDLKNQNQDYLPKYEALVQRNKELDQKNMELADMLNKAIQQQATQYKQKVLIDVAKNASNIFQHLKDSPAISSSKKRKTIIQQDAKSYHQSYRPQQQSNLKISTHEPKKQEHPYKRMMTAKISDHKKKISQSAHKLVELLEVDKDGKSNLDSVNDYQKINDKFESIEQQKSNLLNKINSYAEKLKIL